MESWDDAIDELRQEYLLEAPGQIAGIRGLLAQLRVGPGDKAALAELRRGFHGFAGSGTTYGYPDVTNFGRSAESRCLRALENEHAAPEDVGEWGRLLDAIEASLAAPPAPHEETNENAPGDLSAEDPLDALIVDDDEAVARLLATRLSLEGFCVRSAGTVAAAQACLDRRLPDILVADVMLPDGTGYEVVEALRKLPGGDQSIVLVVSVRTAFVDKVEAIHSGADAYFDKPLDWDAFQQRLRHLLDARRATQARVLSVEDDPHQAALLRSVLVSGGYDVRTCSDPLRFEQEMGAFGPDLVLMDVVLPGASGYDLVRFLRQEDRYATLPVVMVTGESRLEARLSATRAGADDFLLKPVMPGMLLSTVAARIERARSLRGLMDRDGLTRLLTHGAFMERASAAASRASRRTDSRLVWAMIDVDHFKAVNDRHGHPTGDRVLAALAQLLRHRLRQSDVVGRYGGEEFAALVEDLSQEEALRLVDRLRSDFEAMEHRSLAGESFHVTFSAGLAAWENGSDTIDAWKSRADQALYEAKRSGRNKVVLGASPGI